MKIQKNKIELNSLYITKKIEASAFKTVLASTYQTAYRLYYITNSLKELQNFYEVEDSPYMVMATVKTEAALAGEARQQAWNVKHLQPLLNKRPKWIVKCTITEKATNKCVYKSHFVSKNEMSIYQQVQDVIKDIDNVLQAEASI